MYRAAGCSQNRKTGEIFFAGLEYETAGLTLPAEIPAGNFRSLRCPYGNVALNVLSTPFRGLPVKGCSLFEDLELPVDILRHLEISCSLILGRHRLQESTCPDQTFAVLKIIHDIVG